MRIADLKPGWDVISNDGQQLGRINSVRQHFVEVSGGFLSEKLYVPSSAIANVERETVYLNLATADIRAQGWQQPPRSPDKLQTSEEADAHRDI
jgi:hypothetical protein